MTARLAPEDFEDLATLHPERRRSLTDEIRAAAFAEGFEAGRDYGLQQGREAREQVLAGIAEALHERVFTVAEARGEVLRSFVPLLRAITEVLLPAMASAGLRDLVVSEVSALADDPGETLVRVELGRDAAAALAGAAGLPPGLAMVTCPDLAPQELRIRTTRGETHADFGAALAAVARMIDDFCTLTEEHQAHG